MSQRLSTPKIRLSEADFDRSEYDEDPDYLVSTTKVLINGIAHTIQAYRVYEDAEPDSQGAVQRSASYDQDLAAIHRTSAGDGPFMTVELFGDRCVLVITPVCV